MSFHKIERDWKDSDFFGDSPYSERDAWIWIIGAATWEKDAKPISIEGKPVKLKRGQLSHSLRFLGDKFQWKKDKVRRFLNRLLLWDMINIATGIATTQNIITICNYSKYQDLCDNPRDSPRDRGATGARQGRDKEEESTKKGKKDKKERVLSDFDEIALAIKLWNDLCKKIGTTQCQKLTTARKASTKARLKDCSGIEGWKSMLEIVENNPFFHGENDRGWKANIDFVLKEGKFAKIMEGSYNHQKPEGKENAKSKLARETEELLDEIRSRPDSEDVIHPDKRPENIRQGLLR